MRSKLLERLKGKEYRDAFVGSLINIRIPAQIRALRESRGWTQKDLATKADMMQPRISAIETPGGSKLNLETLRRLASAFDCGLLVRFVPFSDLARWEDEFDPDHFSVSSFTDELQGGALRQPGETGSQQSSSKKATAGQGYVQCTATPSARSLLAPLMRTASVQKEARLTPFQNTHPEEIRGRVNERPDTYSTV